ncbi:MAG: PstS family phosphate ABC transporter substrate-binding protein [Thermodesulfobacteriota bacterium]
MHPNWRLCIFVMPVLIAGCFSISSAQQEGKPVTVVGSSTMTNVVDSLAKQYMREFPNSSVVVTPTGTTEGIRLLIEGEQDLAMASRPLKPEETESAARRGIQLVSAQLGRDCLVIIVHEGNPISELSLGDLKGLFSGAVTNWSQLGGPDAPVVCFIRSFPERGSAVFFKETVLGESTYSPECRVVRKFAITLYEVPKLAGAIGYIGLRSIHGATNRGAKVIGIRKSPDSAAVVPSESTMSDGSYPLARPLLLISRASASPETKRFLEFCARKTAQR